VRSTPLYPQKKKKAGVVLKLLKSRRGEQAPCPEQNEESYGGRKKKVGNGDGNDPKEKTAGFSKNGSQWEKGGVLNCANKNTLDLNSKYHPSKAKNSFAKGTRFARRGKGNQNTNKPEAPNPPGRPCGKNGELTKKWPNAREGRHWEGETGTATTLTPPSRTIFFLLKS